ncbi:Autotransporter-associated beta strand repeat-containing protein [Rhodanobacter sp. Root179]
MNHTYRLIWNRALRVMQVASELAVTPHRSGVTAAATRARTPHRLVAVACAAALSVSLVPLPAWATVGGSLGGAGGAGGGAYGGSGGNGNGTGGQGGSGLAGDAGSNGNGGDGGHGGSAISAGGAGGSVGATAIGNTSISGGDGADGQTDPGVTFMSGGGGGGGDGVYTAGTSLTLGVGLGITGGNGGNGGDGDRIGGGGGGGGAGLVVLTDGSTLGNAGSITGGNGGNGATGQWSGGGGGGGDGILVAGANGNLSNSGQITGGAGGASGGPGSFSGAAGEGGAGVDLAADGSHVTNSGDIAGGDAFTIAGAGIVGGNGSQVTNQASGNIMGGATLNSGTTGGNGITATTSGAASFVIDNAGSVSGGVGAQAAPGFSGNGVGGSGIQATGNVTIGNSGRIAGGTGGFGGGGGTGGIGIAATAASGEQISITNRTGGIIEGGYGGVFHLGNIGGQGIHASGNVSIVNQSGASILGDEGGLSDISTTGGAAIVAVDGVSIDNSGTIAGTGGIIAGTAVIANATSIVNRAGGTIQGGNGQGANAGAAAIVANGQTSIDNGGSLVGGVTSDDGTQAIAVLLSGGGNSLLLRAGSSITGAVISSSGTGVGGDSLILGGDVDAVGGNTFDIGSVFGFASHRKSGASTWTLSGNGSAAQTWSITGGTLVGDSSSLVGNIDDGAALVFDQASDGNYAGLVSGAGSLTKTGAGTLTLSGANSYSGGTFINAGTLSVAADGNLGDSSGAVSIGNATLQAGASFSSSRAIEITNSAHIDSQGFDVTLAGPITTASYGNLIKDGAGTLTLTGNANSYQGTGIDAGTLALSGDGAISGTLNIASGAFFDLSQTNAGAQVATLYGDGTVALGAQTLTISLGSSNWSFGGVLADGGIAGGTGGSVVFADDRGSATFSGISTYTGSTTIAAGTWALTGAGSIAASSGLTDNGIFDIAGTSAGASIASLGGGGAVTLGSQTLTLSDAHDSFAGTIGGSGGLVMADGRQVLNGVNTYAGLTELRGGTLLVGDAAYASAAIAGDTQVDSGATLGGHGRIDGDVALQSGGHLAPGGSIGTLSIGGNLGAASGSVLDYEFGAPGADLHTFGAGDSVQVDGDLTLNGAVLNVVDAGGMGAGLYNVFRWGGALVESNGGLAFGATPAGSILQLQTLLASKQINLLNTAGLTLNFWNANGQATATRMGGGSGTWSTTAPLWTDAIGSVDAAMQPQPGFAIFGGDAGTVTVDGGNGAVTASGLQFASDGYVLGGDTLTLVGGQGATPVIRVGDGSSAGADWTATINNVIAGSDGLDKADAGTLILAGNNTYTGGTTVSGGTLSVSADANLGDAGGALVLDGGVLQVTGSSFASTTRALSMTAAGGGFDIVDAGHTFTVAQALDGSGSLRKLGAGSLLLGGANSYSGGTVIEAGILQVGDGGTSGSLGSGAVTNNGTLVFDRSDDVGVAGAISGSGALVKDGAGVLTLTGANSYAGGTTIRAGILQVGDGGTGGSLGSGAVTNDGTLVFDRSDAVGFAGVISGSGALVKDGAGALTLTGANSYAGGTTIRAGTLRGDTVSLQGDIVDHGVLVFDQATDGSYAGQLSGSGSLHKLGGGSLLLGGANSYSGGTVIEAGTLQVGDGGTSGSLGSGAVTNNGTLVFDRSDAVAFAGAISGSGALVKDGAGVLTLTGANSYAGGTTIGAGTLRGDTASVQGDIVDHGALVFDQAVDGSYADDLSGGGSLGKTGAGTLTLSGDNHAFSGDAEVLAGGLAVDGTLGGSLVMDAGTRLSGSGTLGNLDLAGTLAPGHSIGTLSASGDVTIRSGASYEVETDAAGHSDLLAVTGHATLQGGSVLNLASDGSYTTQTTYTILTAAGGVEGQFGAVTTTLAFLDPRLDYLANAVQLTLSRNDVDFCAVTVTANQCATGNAVEHQGGGGLYDGLLSQDVTTTRAALGQWSGESLASTRTALLQDSRFVREAMGDRLHRADTAQDDARAVGTSAGSVWVHGWNHSGHADGDGNASSMQGHGSGILLGVDAPIGDWLRAGITAGEGQDALDVTALDSSAYVKNRHLGMYAGGRWNGWSLDGGVAESWHDIRSTRHVDAVLPGTLRADYHGRTRQAYLEGGYRYTGAHGSVQPFVNLAHVAAYTGQVDERGNITALRSAGETTEVSLGTLGVRGLWQLADSAATPVSLYATLGWRHAFGDLVPLAQQRFADGERFTVSGVPLRANAALVQLGIDAGLSRHTRLRAGYDGVLAGRESDHAVRMTLQVTF